MKIRPTKKKDVEEKKKKVGEEFQEITKEKIELMDEVLQRNFSALQKSIADEINEMETYGAFDVNIEYVNPWKAKVSHSISNDVLLITSALEEE